MQAAEAINELPEIDVTVSATCFHCTCTVARCLHSRDAEADAEVLLAVSDCSERLDASSFNRLRGITAHQRTDSSLYHQDKPAKGSRKSASSSSSKSISRAASSLASTQEDEDDPFAIASSSLPAAADGKEKDSGSESKRSFFRVRCVDNGAGMPHAAIPSMLGVVLSSTKYGVKQTRGKFGLGAKMALVWSKKSTGLPIEVRSSTAEDEPVSDCVLDIDIHRNQPRVLRHEQTANSEGWRGTEISVVIEGNWTSYGSKVRQYFRQLAVITPYANLRFAYRDTQSEKRSFSLSFTRRTDVMPPQAQEVKHHPSSVDNLLVESLIHHSKEKKLKSFLSHSFSSITPAHAARLISELRHNSGMTADTAIASLSKKDIHQLTQLLKEARFDKPSDECLSPAGEYNLRLGIVKELRPEMVATFRDAPGVSEGHPFLVEAAVSLGGECKPGINVFRYANRIPLLFEGSNDVVSVVCTKDVRWSAYRIRHVQDRIGVYVSIVSSKIPFKGTSKEYIGDDRDVLHASVKRSVVQCCLQLKKRILSRQKQREKDERKRLLRRYVPDVCRALWSVLDAMRKDGGAMAKHQEAREERLRAKRRREDEQQAEDDALAVDDGTQRLYESTMKRLRAGEVTQQRLSDALLLAVDRKNSEMMMEFVVEQGRKSGEVEQCELGILTPALAAACTTLQHPMAVISLL